MNVLMISPGFPKEMQYFTRGLAAVGANVVGLGDQHESQLPEEARRALSATHRYSKSMGIFRVLRIFSISGK